MKSDSSGPFKLVVGRVPDLEQRRTRFSFKEGFLMLRIVTVLSFVLLAAVALADEVRVASKRCSLPVPGF
jgi:hypothetical protein